MNIRFLTLLIVSLGIALMGSPVRADLLGIEQDTGNLLSISTADGSLTLIGSTGISGDAGLGTLEFAPDGTLYGFTIGSSAQLYALDPVTAAAAAVGSLGQNFVFEGGLAFAPDGTAYATNGGIASTPELLRIDVTTGTAVVIGTISGGAHDINGLAYRSDGQLIGLDRETNSLLLIDPTTAVSSLLAVVPTTVGAVGGMTILNGVGYYNTSGPAGSFPGSNSLYSFDLDTGVSTLIGTFNLTGFGISGLAGGSITVVPEPGTFALLFLGGAGFVLWKRRRRSVS